MESLAYILIRFLQGFLPWEGLRRSQDILQAKQQIPARELCKGLPVEFQTFLEYSRSLPFNAKPEYDQFFDLSGGLLSCEALDKMSVVLDWEDERTSGEQCDVLCGRAMGLRGNGPKRRKE